jgi:predicted permease
MTSPWPNLKIAARSLAQRPSFSLMVIGLLGLGIAGNVAIFSVFNALFLRPLPFAEPERLVDIDETAPQWNLKFVGVARPDYEAWQKHNSTFERMAFFDESSFNLSGQESPQRVRAFRVSRDLLDILRLKPALGRDFLPEEDLKGGRKVAMLSNGLWRRLFNGDPGAIGRILKLDSQPYTIVGILPPEAVFPLQAELWVPLAGEGNEGSWFLSGVGRLKPGVTLQQASADLLRVHKGLVQTGRKENDITSPVLTPLRERYLGDYRTVSRVLLGAVGIVLLIACVNIAGLMMVRGAGRSREIAIRTALGASRASIVRQLLGESFLLAAAGAMAGAGAGALLLRFLIAFLPEDTPAFISFAPDYRFVLFTLAITAASAILFGLAPAFHVSAIDTRGALQESGTRTSLSRGRRGALSALVVAEIALAITLLAGAGLLVQAFRKVLTVDPGFRADHVLTFALSLPETGYAKQEKRIAFFREVVEQLRALPGVTSAGATSATPLGGHWGMFFAAEGAQALGPNEKDPVILQIVATPGYLETMGVTFLAGRSFTALDGDPKGHRVAIVNQSFANRFWPGQSPVGKRIRYRWQKKEEDWMQVVGLTRDTRHYGLDQEMRPGVFVPYPQNSSPSMTVVLRSSKDPTALAAPAREVVRSLDPELPLFEVRTMSDRLDRSLWTRRAYSWLFAAFAAVALILSAAGLYGVVSYAVSQRTHEIGIRMALGARPFQVLRQILAGGMGLAALGIAIGLAAALAGARFLETLLFGVSSTSPLTYAAVALAVAAVALLANLLPARRAAAVDPMSALRCE